MKKLLFIPALALLLAFIGCGFPGEPMLDDAYPRDIYMTEGYVIILEGDSRLWLEFRPELDFEKIRGNAGIPTLVNRGIFSGFSLPIWAANNEELYLNFCIPTRWDEASNIHIEMDCYMAVAQDAANDAFNMQVAWEVYTPDVDIVPAASNLLTTEVTTGVCAQFQSFHSHVIIPFAGISADDNLALRVRRVAVVVGNEADGEIVVEHIGIIIRRDNFGTTVAP